MSLTGEVMTGHNYEKATLSKEKKQENFNYRYQLKRFLSSLYISYFINLDRFLFLKSKNFNPGQQ